MSGIKTTYLNTIGGIRYNMSNYLDYDCPRKLEILRLLLKQHKMGVFKRKIWKNRYRLYEAFGNVNSTRKIIEEFIVKNILIEDNSGIFLNEKFAISLLKDTFYIELAKEIGFVDNPTIR